jgi:hypothetical protein
MLNTFFPDCQESSLNPVTAISTVPFIDGDVEGDTKVQCIDSFYSQN